MMRPNPYQRLYRIFRLLHQRNRYVAEEPSTGLTLLEAHLLTELDASPNMTQSDLLSLLQVDQSTLSRTIKRLERSHLVTVKSDTADARRKRLALAEKGRKLVVRSDELTDETFDELSARLSPLEAASIGKLYQAIADGLGHPAGNQRPGESSYRFHQRRITRCFGLLRDDVWGVGRPGTQWQVLTEVASATSPYRTIALANKLSISGSALWSHLNALEEEGLIARAADDNDRRSVLVEATARGRHESATIESRAAELLARALSDVSPKMVEKWTTTLERFAQVSDASESSELPGCNYKLAIRTAERVDARAFIISALAASGEAHTAPEVLAGSKELVVQVVHKDGIVAVLSGPKVDSSWSITVAATRAPLTQGALPRAIAGSLSRYVLEQAGARTIEVTYAPLLRYSDGGKRPARKRR
jgi:MarR family transcriptional regulator for hemolysin